MANPRPKATSTLLARPVGVEHNIVNPGGREFAFVEVEIK
jgi:hypothetical protein